MIRKMLQTSLLAFLLQNAGAQNNEVFLRIVSPSKEKNIITANRQFITGLTCKTCSIFINGQAVKVFPTGTFAYEVLFPGGDSVFNIRAGAANGKNETKTISYSYIPPVPETPVTTISIGKIQTFPEGDLVLREGDLIHFRVKAFPGGSVTVFNKSPLYELPLSHSGGMPGIYQGEYQVRAGDNFSAIKIPVTLITDSGRVTKETTNKFSVMSALASDIAQTKGRLAYLKYGLGEDRLGGAKIGYLDSLIPLKIIGKVGINYKVQLAKNRTAYIEEDLVTLLPKGTFAPSSLTTNWRVYGDSAFDYVQVGLTGRSPYQSMQLLDPSAIVVDIFGATNNTNWISQLGSVKEIANVDYDQVADDIFRITIRLKHPQHWGYQVYYSGNILVIKVKQQPKILELNRLTIGIDPGHGGSNTGAQGLTGVIEKDLTLAVSLKLQRLLETAGAKVIMSRSTERYFDNKERILFYRDSLPDLLVSIHLNSSTDPLTVKGTMMFYRYPGFRSLNETIYKRMLELGLAPGGITGSFNFMLNSPTEYPNALVEALFLSNLEEESNIVDPGFQQQIAEKIMKGIKDFLQEVSK